MNDFFVSDSVRLDPGSWQKAFDAAVDLISIHEPLIHDPESQQILRPCLWREKRRGHRAQVLRGSPWQKETPPDCAHVRP